MKNVLKMLLMGMMATLLASFAFAKCPPKSLSQNIIININFTISAPSFGEASAQLDKKMKDIEDHAKQQSLVNVWLRSMNYNVNAQHNNGGKENIYQISGSASYGMESTDGAFNSAEFVSKNSEDGFSLSYSQLFCKKPVIYLYPPATEKVKVELDFKGGFQTTYPAYDPAIKGWSVTAHPDGTLVNDADGKEYSYLFWDGKSYDFTMDMSEGFVVKGSDTAKFLQATLKKLGLTPKEYNEFIVYWLPKMQDNPYNFIRFAGKEYTDAAPLTITPKPDSLLRVFMIFKPLQDPISVKPQPLPTFDRHGFAVVECGGTEIAEDND